MDLSNVITMCSTADPTNTKYDILHQRQCDVHCCILYLDIWKLDVSHKRQHDVQ